jgi:hypothetical protein
LWGIRGDLYPFKREWEWEWEEMVGCVCCDMIPLPAWSSVLDGILGEKGNVGCLFAYEEACKYEKRGGHTGQNFATLISSPRESAKKK